jgi:hypothetical protein
LEGNARRKLNAARGIVHRSAGLRPPVVAFLNWWNEARSALQEIAAKFSVTGAHFAAIGAVN